MGFKVKTWVIFELNCMPVVMEELFDGFVGSSETRQ